VGAVLGPRKGALDLSLYPLAYAGGEVQSSISA